MLYGDYACRIIIRPLLFTVGPSDDFRAGMKEGRSAPVGFTGRANGSGAPALHLLVCGGDLGKLRVFAAR